MSIKKNLRPFHSASYLTRSLVTPGVSSTIASRRPIIRFTKVDFPTFGRPITAIVGRPKRFRCFNHFQTWSTTSCSDSLVESITAASSACINGETALVESTSSLLAKDFPTSLRSIDSIISFSRRWALASISACR